LVGCRYHFVGSCWYASSDGRACSLHRSNMNEDEHTNEEKWFHEILERGRLAAKQREEERAKQDRRAKLIEAVILLALFAVLIFSALFWN